jgi:protein SCO1/2
MGASLFAVAAVLAFAAPAPAAEHLHGIVLSVNAAAHQALVRHEPYGGMPAMTMQFTIPEAPVLHPGDKIEADVAGETLSEVRVLSSAPASPPSILHDVALVNVGDALPEGPFVDQLGRPFHFGDFRGKQVVLAFIYSRCTDPKMCPLISAGFKRLQDTLAPGSFHLVEMTLDPAFDTPPVLERYGHLFGADPAQWTIGTGPPRAVLDFAARFGITEFADPQAGLIHSERTVLIDRTGRIADFIDDASWNPSEVAQRLRSMDSLPSNPIARLDYELSKVAVAVCGNRVAGYSGLMDLAIVIAIFASFGWLTWRIARRIFSAPA